MPTLSVDQQRNLYKQHIDAWKKAKEAKEREDTKNSLFGGYGQFL